MVTSRVGFRFRSSPSYAKALRLSPGGSSSLLSSTSTSSRYRAGIHRVVHGVGGHHSLTAVLAQVELMRGAVQGPALWPARTPRCMRTSSRRSAVGPDAATPDCLLIAHPYTTTAAAAAAVMRAAAGHGLSRRHLLTATASCHSCGTAVFPRNTLTFSPLSTSPHLTSKVLAVEPQRHLVMVVVSLTPLKSSPLGIS